MYLTTPHGLWINAWDGSYHYACYLFLAACLLRARHSYSDSKFRTVGLLWSGSILNSMIVLFVGSAVGNHAKEIKPSYLLNIPYALFPAIFLVRVIQARPTEAGSEIAATAENNARPAASISARKPLWQWLLDVPLLALTFLSSSLCILRLLVVLRSEAPVAAWYGKEIEAHLTDPSAYPTLQVITYAFYLVPYFLWAMVWLWSGPPPVVAAGGASSSSSSANAASSSSFSSFRDWTLFAIGALLQGTFSYMGAALHQGEAFQSSHWAPQQRKGGAFAFFLAANVGMMILPMLILARISIGGRNSGAQRVKAQ